MNSGDDARPSQTSLVSDDELAARNRRRESIQRALLEPPDGAGAHASSVVESRSSEACGRTDAEEAFPLPRTIAQTELPAVPVEEPKPEDGAPSHVLVPSSLHHDDGNQHTQADQQAIDGRDNTLFTSGLRWVERSVNALETSAARFLAIEDEELRRVDAATSTQHTLMHAKRELKRRRPGEEKSLVWNPLCQPPPSYFAVTTEASPTSQGRSHPLHISDIRQEDSIAVECSNVSTMQSPNSKHEGHHQYQPRQHMCDLPSARIGRELEYQRFAGVCPTPFTIPLFDQACLKYIFTEAFDTGLDPMEIVSVLSFVLSLVTNLVSSALNVSDTTTTATQEWIVVLKTVIFAVEFAFVWFMFLVLFVTVCEAVYKDNIGTDLASDCVDVGQLVAGFSSIRVVGWANPGFAARLIMPELRAAVVWQHYFRVAFYVMIYLAACGLAGATVILKVTQIDFASTVAIDQWTLSQWLQLIGFVLNIAKVDDSYATETSCLLGAVHRHYCTPGQPTNANKHEECLYTRVCRRFGLRRRFHYEYFEVVFDFHFGTGSMKNLSTSRKINKMLNFMSFILKIDNALLRQYLQMVSSPLTFYAMARDAFEKAYREGDLSAMDMALWRSDPEDLSLKVWAYQHKKFFDIVFRCEDPLGTGGIHELESFLSDLEKNKDSSHVSNRPDIGAGRFAEDAPSPPAHTS